MSIVVVGPTLLFVCYGLHRRRAGDAAEAQRAQPELILITNSSNVPALRLRALLAWHWSAFGEVMTIVLISAATATGNPVRAEPAR